jgi:hypothetical protein
MKDLLKAGNGDLSIVGNDLAIGVSDRQHQEDLILDEKGSIKQFPDTGVGAQEFLESEDESGLLREVSLQFTADGMNVKKVAYDSAGKLIVDAPYKS